MRFSVAGLFNGAQAAARDPVLDRDLTAAVIIQGSLRRCSAAEAAMGERKATQPLKIVLAMGYNRL